ncbi:Uncharacterized protein APZ42_008361, partial [Daphnia magna]
ILVPKSFTITRVFLSFYLSNYQVNFHLGHSKKRWRKFHLLL